MSKLIFMIFEKNLKSTTFISSPNVLIININNIIKDSRN